MTKSTVIRTVLLFAAVGVANIAAAQNYDFGQDRTIAVWDNGTAPHSNGLTGEERFLDAVRVTNTVSAELYVFDADPAKSTGQAVIICPGGGYEMLAAGHEGSKVAEWLAGNGITAYVLKYRLPNGHPEVPFEDAVEALRLVRSDGKYDKTGIMGFSAGGHLAACVSTLAADVEKPDFTVLFYPVISSDERSTHKGSFDNLLGRDRTAEVSRKYSLERCVTDTTPATLLLLSDDDAGVPPAGSAAYYSALKEHGIPASMVIFPTGGHGWGFNDWFGYKAEWQNLLLRWLEGLK